MMFMGIPRKYIFRNFSYPLLLMWICLSLVSCTAGEQAGADKTPAGAALRPASPAEIMARPEVPILCYHQLRDFRPGDGPRAKDYIVPPARFADQMRRLADSGYHTILPDDLYDYLLHGKPLPSRPVMLTFDDTDLEQYTVGNAEMKKYGFKGVFFIMTVSLNRPGYMSREQVRELALQGHVIGSHSWDHHNVKKYSTEDWITQVEKPSRLLQEITGKPVDYFAYPFGLWDAPAAGEIARRGFKAAFQLSEKRDSLSPLYTIRRIIIPGTWETDKMFQRMYNSFH